MSKNRTVTDHFIVVTKWFFEHDRGTDVEVVHPDCRYVEGEHIGGIDFGGRYACDVEQELLYDGFEFLTDENGYDVNLDQLPSGKYPLVWECRYSPDEYRETELWIIKSKREVS